MGNIHCTICASLLYAHMGHGLDPFLTFVRLLTEKLINKRYEDYGHNNPLGITPDQISAPTDTEYGLSQLYKLMPSNIGGPSPDAAHLKRPILIVACPPLKELLLLDGNHRLKHWKNSGAGGGEKIPVHQHTISLTLAQWDEVKRLSA